MHKLLSQLCQTALLPMQFFKTTFVFSAGMLVLMITGSVFAAASDVFITKADDGKTIQAIVGQTIEVSLPSNPTTGYEWLIRGNPALLTFITSEFVADAQGQKRIGAGGTQKLRFEASAAGNVAIVLDYKRPWEKDKAPAKTFTVAVEVK